MDYTTKYFRITAYYPKENVSFIMDSNGKFEKLWQFSAFLIAKGCKILEASTDEKFLDVNITKAEQNSKLAFLRAAIINQPQYFNRTIDGIIYKAVQVGEKKYVIDKNITYKTTENIDG